jgi:precorrin-3B synthase
MNVRGACPSITAPMQTGDGLLARLIVHEPISVGKLSALCAAAEEYGNGIMEVTQRGNLQIRGLDEGSAPKFADVVDSLQVGQDAGPPLLTSPLLGLDPGELLQSATLVQDLLDVFGRLAPVQASLGPKVSVLIDGGGRLHLDGVSADIRLVAVEPALLQLGLAGNAQTAMQLGYVTVPRAAEAVELLLQALAVKGPAARARDLVHEPVTQDLHALLHTRELKRAAPSQPPEPISMHPLKDGTVALGFALPFGHTTASDLKQVVRAAAEHGTHSIRPAPGRALLALGLTPTAADKLREVIRAAGFVADPGDPRRHVVACVGSPACSSAKLSTRQLATDVARATQTLANTANVVHLAGCSKGCAHAGVAALTIVGPDRIILNGRAGDPPYATISSAGLIADLTRLFGGS